MGPGPGRGCGSLMRRAAGIADRSRPRSLTPAALPLLLGLALTACASSPAWREPAAVTPPVRERPPISVPSPPRLEPSSPGAYRVPVASLKGWSADDHRAALSAFRLGCRAARSPALRQTCRAAEGVEARDDTAARMFFEHHFQAEVLPGEGVLTGYFAPVYPASHRRVGAFTAPVRPPPPSGQLVDVRMSVAQVPSPRPSTPSIERPDTTDRTIAAASPSPPPPLNPAPTVSASLNLASLERPVNDPVADLLDRPSTVSPVPLDPTGAGQVTPAPSGPDDAPPLVVRVRMKEADRATIDQAPTDGIITWMRPEDLFFMQIQGSGVLVFPEGERLRAAYAGDNGKPFVGIARPMIRDGLLPVTGASGDGIRRWLATHAGDAAEAVMQKNPRYVFFRLGTDNGAEPQGAAGIPLPAGRAIAMDSSHHDFGSLYWIDAEAPTLSGATAQYHRLAVDLDTGGAIRGPIRADLYFGTGDEAGREAGRVKHVLHLARLVPIDGDLSEERDAAAASPRGR